MTRSGNGREDRLDTADTACLERNPSMSVPSSVQGSPGVRADLIAELVRQCIDSAAHLNRVVIQRQRDNAGSNPSGPTTASRTATSSATRSARTPGGPWTVDGMDIDGFLSTDAASAGVGRSSRPPPKPVIPVIRNVFGIRVARCGWQQSARARGAWTRDA